jgi:anaerobic dimethyl sulfoxide reductase subunit B (iron-sulfur subunit)
MQWEKGAWPNVRAYALAISCYHCENPLCVDAADGAMFKEEKYGAVLIDPEKASSPSMRKAWEACPYGVIMFDSDAPIAKASMCNMCIDRLEQGLKPVCVMSCPQIALDFDTLENLQTKYGTNRDLPDLPSSATVSPAVIFKPALPKKQLVSYDANAALQINAKRPKGPALYNSPSDVTDIPEGLISRNKPVLKAQSLKDALHYTTDNES